MPIEIRETTVEPVGSDFGVQLHIADAPLDDESATFVLTLRAQIRRPQTEQLFQYQREALLVASQALRDLIDAASRT